MEIINEEPLELWEVKKLLEKRKGGKDQFDRFEQRRVYEYIVEVTKLDDKNAKELLKTLTEKLNLPKKIAVQIVDVLPLSRAELTPFIKQIEEEKGELSPEEKNKLVEELIGELKKYKEKARSLVEEIKEKSE